MLALAISLTYAAARFPVLPFDQKAYEELKEKTSPLFDMLMEGVSDLGELAFALALTAIAMVIFAVRRKWLEAIFMLATTSSVLLAFVLKDLIQRPRPFPLNQNATGFIQTSTNTVIPAGMSYFLSSFLDSSPILRGYILLEGRV